MRALHVVPLLLIPALAHADADDATESVKTGTFLPFTETPANESHSAQTFGTYDGARSGASLMTTVQAMLSEKVQIQGRIDFDDGEAQPSIGAQYGLLDRKTDGFDLQVAGGLEANGFNQVPAVFALGGIGGFYRETYLVGNVGFELGTERGEAASTFGLAGLRDLGGDLYMGFDSHMSFDLERDDMEPEGEASWEIQAGPLVSVPLGRFALTAGFGMSAREERNAMTSNLGAYGSVGAGAVF
jgi:hypothetical protein